MELPTNLWFIQEIAGLLVAATFAENWEEIGDVSIDDAVEWASTTFGSFNSMVGMIIPVLWETIPDGFLLCDGAGYLRVDYPTLYANLPAAFIIDADNFVVPDLLGRTIVGSGDGSGLSPQDPGDMSGEETHTLTTAEMPSHTHSITVPGLPLPFAPAAVPADAPPALPSLSGSAGGDGAHNNMQPYTVITYVIAAR